MQKFFRDAPLNTIPLCAPIDETAETQVVLSHIFYARAETHLLLAQQAKTAGIAVSRGKIINRGLSGVNNGNDMDAKDPGHSQAFDEVYKDPHIAQAKQYLQRSMDVLRETSLSRDLHSFDNVREVPKDSSATAVEKQFDADGVEIPEEVQTEVATTTLIAHDLSLAEAQKSFADTYIDMTGGPNLYPTVKERVVKDLRVQCGVKLTDRGTKGHQNSRVDTKQVYVSCVFYSTSCLCTVRASTCLYIRILTLT